MKALIVSAVLAAASTPALAGGWSFGIGIDSDGDVRVGLGYRGHREHRHHKHERQHRVRTTRRVVVRDRHHCDRHWVPGHYDTVRRKVFVPGYTKRVWEPAVYEWRRDRCGHRYRVKVRAAGYRRIHVKGRYEVRTEQVWHPGTWKYDCNVEGHRHHKRHNRLSDHAKKEPTVVRAKSKRDRRHT